MYIYWIILYIQGSRVPISSCWQGLSTDVGRAIFRKGSKPIKTTASGQMKTSMEVRNKSTSGDGQFLVSFAFGDCVHIIYDIHIFIKIYSDIIIYIYKHAYDIYIYMTYIILCIVYYIHLYTIYIYILSLDPGGRPRTWGDSAGQVGFPWYRDSPSKMEAGEWKIPGKSYVKWMI